MNGTNNTTSSFDIDRQRPNTIQLPPRPTSNSSTFVFTSSRSSRVANKPPTPAALDSAFSVPPMDATQTLPSSSKSASRKVLSEGQLLRHGHGSLDLRAQLVQAKTPAGFIPLSSASPPALGSPPRYDPSENPFFPPLAVLGAKPNASPIVPTHDSSPMPGWMRYRVESDTSCLTSDSERPYSTSSSSTLVSSPRSPGLLAQSTDVRINSRQPTPRRDSTATLVNGHQSHELSLSELFVHDWVGMRAGGWSSTSTVVARGSSCGSVREEKPRKTKERDGKKEKRSRRSGDGDAHQSSSDSDWAARKLMPVDELDAMLARVEISSKDRKRDHRSSKVDDGHGAERAAAKEERRSSMRTSYHVKSRLKQVCADHLQHTKNIMLTVS